MNAQVAALQDELNSLCARIARRIQIMEVCGTHTVSFFRSGIRSMLPPNLRLISGPGCPVCVTAQRHIDAAISLAARPDVMLATYGDMLRVPGHLGSLERLRARGADIQVISSATSALRLAHEHPARNVIFFAVGFETTAPATAHLVLRAHREKIRNLSVLLCHKRVVPAMTALLESGDIPLDGFLCPGHVSVIIGSQAYLPIVTKYRKPCVVAGFEPVQLLTGLVHLLRQIQQSRPGLENVYPAVVNAGGNKVALELMRKVFIVANAPWRELGTIPGSGFELAPEFKSLDAISRFGISLGRDLDNPACKCGQVIQGMIDPPDCPLFDHGCTPLTPVGPCMVSGEGTCASWYKYNRTCVVRSQKLANMGAQK